MKLSNGEIFNAKGPLQKLVQLPMPIRTGFLLARLANILNTELVAIEKVRVGLVHKYGVPNEQGQVAITPDNPCWADFVADFEELMRQEVALNFDKPMLPGDLAIEPSVLMALEKFVDIGT